MLKYASLTLPLGYNIEKGRGGRKGKIWDWKTHAFNETGLFRGVSQLLLSMIVEARGSDPRPALSSLHKYIYYRGFHLTFDARVPKFVGNFRSWGWTWLRSCKSSWELHREITTWTSQPQFRNLGSWGIILNPFTPQGKALPNNVGGKIVDDWLQGRGPTEIGK